MKDFYLVDDDCLNFFDDIVQFEQVCVIAPMSTIKKLMFWILGEDDEANPAVVLIDTDYDDPDENDNPYLLCYVPGLEFDLGPLGFSIKGFDGPVFIYDGLKMSCLSDIDEDEAIPFHYKSEDHCEKEGAIAKKKEDKKEDNAGGKIEITTDEDGMAGFTDHLYDDSGNYNSYAFYSTDKNLVEKAAERRADIVDILTKRKG